MEPAFRTLMEFWASVAQACDRSCRCTAALSGSARGSVEPTVGLASAPVSTLRGLHWAPPGSAAVRGLNFLKVDDNKNFKW